MCVCVCVRACVRLYMCACVCFCVCKNDIQKIILLTIELFVNLKRFDLSNYAIKYYIEHTATHI